MSFNGSLLRMGSDNFNLSWVFKESYKITPSARLDLDPFRNTEGWLMRNVLQHTASKISFQVKPMWNAGDYDHNHTAMWSFIRSHYTNEHDRKLTLTYYCPDIDDYATGEFYIPDFTPPMDLVDTVNRRIMFLSYELQFIEY